MSRRPQLPTALRTPSISHSRNAVPALISQAREIERHHVQLTTTSGHTMDFRQKTGPSYLDDCDAATTVELYVDGVLSFAIDAAISYGEYGDSWFRPSVTAFIEGPWANDILTIAQQHRIWSRSVLDKAEADSSERDRKRFGI